MKKIFLLMLALVAPVAQAEKIEMKELVKYCNGYARTVMNFIERRAEGIPASVMYSRLETLDPAVHDRANRLIMYVYSNDLSKLQAMKEDQHFIECMVVQTQ